MGSSLLLVQPRWKVRVDSWKTRIQEEANLVSYLVLLRMAPVPPHSVVNIASPHLGVALVPFWISTAAGTAAVSFIQVTVGEKLEEMTTPEEMHLLTPRNTLLLAGMLLAAVLPLVVRRKCHPGPLEADPPAGPLGQVALPRDSYSDSDFDSDSESESESESDANADLDCEGQIALRPDTDVEARGGAVRSSPRSEPPPVPWVGPGTSRG